MTDLEKKLGKPISVRQENHGLSNKIQYIVSVDGYIFGVNGVEDIYKALVDGIKYYNQIKQ